MFRKNFMKLKLHNEVSLEPLVSMQRTSNDYSCGDTAILSSSEDSHIASRNLHGSCGVMLEKLAKTYELVEK